MFSPPPTTYSAVVMAPSEKECQTKSAHNPNEHNDYKDDVTSETSSLQLYHNEWEERQLEHVQPTNFSFKDSLPQVNLSSYCERISFLFF